MESCCLPTFEQPSSPSSPHPYVFDIVRKKYVRLTPEEYTRQHLLNYLIHILGYPKSLISVERKIGQSQRINRPDLVVYNSQGLPLLLAECKAAHVPITPHVYYQLMRYNRQLQAPFAVITNGRYYGCWAIKEGGKVIESLDRIPLFKNLSTLDKGLLDSVR
jgi:hypothetical protein